MQERVIKMDITYFVSWFLTQVFDIFTKIFKTLDSITFLGTSLLRFSITLVILGVLIPVILTIGQSTAIVGQRSQRISDRRERAERRSKKK